MNLESNFNIKAKIWLWNFEKGSWHFVTIPFEVANEIYFAQKLKNMGQRRGFGSIKVEAKIGNSIFLTSIFPNSKDKTYVMPIKATIRKAENIKDGDEIMLNFKIL